MGRETELSLSLLPFSRLFNQPISFFFLLSYFSRLVKCPYIQTSRNSATNVEPGIFEWILIFE